MCLLNGTFVIFAFVYAPSRGCIDEVTVAAKIVYGLSERQLIL